MNEAKRSPLYDGLADGASIGAVVRAEHARLRVARPLSGGEEGFGPAPGEIAILTFGEGDAARIDCGDPNASRDDRVAGVALREEEYAAEGRNPCRLRFSCQCVVELEASGAWVLAEQRAETAETARAGMEALRAAVAREGEPPTGDAPAPLPAERLQLRGEGPRVVLRDWGGETPRDGAGGYGRAATALGLVTAATGAGAAWLATTPDRGLAAGLGVAAALFAVATYAFFEIARHARAYAASSAPVLALGQGRVIVAPWPDRRGAVDLKLEGRFGAAIPLAEVERVEVGEAAGGHALRLFTMHGPFDVFLTADRAEAERWRDEVASRLERMRTPGAGPSVKKLVRALA